jgi:hypothetical protein
MNKWSPEGLRIHPLSVRKPDECHWLLSHGTHYAMQYQAAAYWDWLKNLDDESLRLLHGNYKRQVQALQLHRGGKQWLSKSMSHLHFLPVFRDVFPDAGIIRLHRDPAEVIPSLCNLYKHTRFGFVGRNTDLQLGPMVLDMFVDGATRQIRSDTLRFRDRVVDICFTDLIADPLTTVRRIYGQLGRSCDRAMEERIHAYLLEDRMQEKYLHKYKLEDFGLSEELVERRTVEYRQWLAAKTSVAAPAPPA